MIPCTFFLLARSSTNVFFIFSVMVARLDLWRKHKLIKEKKTINIAPLMNKTIIPHRILNYSLR